MILLSRYSWLGRYLCVARCCWSVSSWKSPSSALGTRGEHGLDRGGSAQWEPQSPSPGKGHCPCWHSLVLTLQQVGDEQRRALVTAGQPPLCQVLLDLEGEEVPVEGDRSPGGNWVLGWAMRAVPVPKSPPMDALPQGHRMSVQPLQKAAAGHHYDQHVPVIEMLTSRCQN